MCNKSRDSYFTPQISDWLSFIIPPPSPLCSFLTPQSAASNVFLSRCCLNKCCCPSLAVMPPRCSPAVPPCLTLYASTDSTAPRLLPSRRDTLWVPCTLRPEQKITLTWHTTLLQCNPWCVKLSILWTCHLNVCKIIWLVVMTYANRC